MSPPGDQRGRAKVFHNLWSVASTSPEESILGTEKVVDFVVVGVNLFDHARRSTSELAARLKKRLKLGAHNTAVACCKEA